MTRVTLSRWNVPTPKGSDISFKAGEDVLLTSRQGRGTIIVTIVDGELKSHPDVPGDYVYEVIFPASQGGGIYAVNADQISPIEFTNTGSHG